MSDDITARLAALETRLALLEKAMLQRMDQPAPWPGYPTPLMPLPMAGCVCPSGAEISCGGWNCPRRTQVVATASDTLTTTAIGSIPRNGSGVCKTCPPGWCGAGSESFCPERNDGKLKGPG